MALWRMRIALECRCVEVYRLVVHGVRIVVELVADDDVVSTVTTKLLLKSEVLKML